MSLFNNPILDFFLNPWFIFSLIFWLVVLLLVFLLRKKEGAAYLFFPLLAMFKTKRLNRLIKRISRKRPKSWRVFWTIGVFVSFSFTIYAFYFFFSNFVNLIIDPRPEYGIYPLIPGVTINFPLFSYMILPLLFIVTTHEFAHGIAANADELDIKSTGVLGAGLFFVIGFGAFVEINEREANSSKVSRYTRLRIASAGTYINGITAGLAFVLILIFPLMISPWYRQVTQVNTVFKEEEGGFNYGNLSSGDAILAIKKKGTNDTNYVYLDENKGVSLTSILSNKTVLQCSAGDNLTLKTYNPSLDVFQEKNVTLGPRYYIGIQYQYLVNGSGFEITKIIAESEDGNNYDKNLTVGLIIEEVNGIPINVSNGDTLEKIFTSSFNLTTINLSQNSLNWTLDVATIGVLIGVYTNSYFMFKNDVGKFFTSSFPEFFLRELSWLFLIAFSITLFNMLPLPIFDGDRLVKELINWGIGEDYKSVKTKNDKFIFKTGENDYELSEYRVEKINSIKMIIEDQSKLTQPSNIILAEENYELFDKIGDGFKDTVSLKLPEQSTLSEGTKVEISYDYWYDEKKKVKSIIINVLRAITLFILAGNFIISITKFGGVLFWI
ncbi:MAG: site-2 protease family protein [Promethearchaeota archaeon]|jgi:membrane-associated protease RseP (regulator of RpoE activity)